MFGINPFIVSLIGAALLYVVSRLSYRALLMDYGRGARIMIALFGGGLISTSIYLLVTDLWGAILGIVSLIVVATLKSGRRLKPADVDYVTEEPLLEDAVSPELHAELENLSAAVSSDRPVAELPRERGDVGSPTEPTSLEGYLKQAESELLSAGSVQAHSSPSPTAASQEDQHREQPPEMAPLAIPQESPSYELDIPGAPPAMPEGAESELEFDLDSEISESESPVRRRLPPLPDPS